MDSGFSIKMARNLYQEMRDCRLCSYVREKGITPFCFPYHGQKVMFMSLVPNLQAVRRPLASIRFFRAVYTALFGANPAGTAPVADFEDKFYWTHYHKCYYPPYFSSKHQNPPPNCKNVYLDREIKVFGPGLKLIIVSGAPLIKTLFGEEVDNVGLKHMPWSKKEPIDCVLVPFPKTGAEPQFQDLRKLLKQSYGFREIDDEAVPDDRGVQGHDEPRFREYAQFELGALEMYFERVRELGRLWENNSNGRLNTDDLWRDREVIPRLNRYSFIVSCDSFVEDQARAFLFSLGIISTPSGRDPLIRLIKDQLDRERRQQLDDLNNGLRYLRKIRNAIVHEGGRPIDLSPHKSHAKSLEISFEPNGTLILDDDDCQAALDIARKFINILY